MITFSYHALRRCERRCITFSQVRTAIRKGHYVPIRNGVYKVFRKRLRVILAVTGLVITVYRVRRFRKSSFKRQRQHMRRLRRAEKRQDCY